MLAMGRALMAEPRYLLLDEPSLGLAPRLVEQIRDLIVEINRQGTGVLLVEQNATMALSIASHGYVMETGKVVLDKPASGTARRRGRARVLPRPASGGRRRSPSARSSTTSGGSGGCRDATQPTVERRRDPRPVDAIVRRRPARVRRRQRHRRGQLHGRPARAVRGDRPERRRQDLDLQRALRRLPAAAGPGRLRRRRHHRQASAPDRRRRASPARSRTSSCSRT